MITATNERNKPVIWEEADKAISGLNGKDLKGRPRELNRS
jgi:hypothetical protein